ncbi:MAG: insulinase family protein, partial [Bacteroidales bacterium]|nr:insulinase family protein [Bacteroidales bacterium]
MKRILTLLATLAVYAAAAAQTIPAGPEFRTGKLANGMTYYVAHNENPAGCAEFYIAHNIGALQEEDNQNGLAHFLEHMAF